MIIVSACLMGAKCRYDGEAKECSSIKKLIKYGVVPLCPEQLGGLATPRKSCEISGGCGCDVLSHKACVIANDLSDNTEYYIKGAYETLKIGKYLNIKYAVLKQRSPSCGSKFIHDGSFSGKVINGNGVTTELLIRNGIKVYSEDNFEEELIKKKLDNQR